LRNQFTTPKIKKGKHMAGRFLSLFKPLSRVMPEVATPARKVGFNEKLFWTAIALILYLVMAEVPLYGVGKGGWDLTYLRIIFASNRGTLMELGIGPIVTAGLILQLLSGSGIIGCDMSNPDDRALFTTASKFFSILMTGVQAGAYLIGGVYNQTDPTTGVVTLLPVGAIFIIFFELLFAGIIVMMLDELVQKGWGIGSGISLFIMAGVAQQIFWQSFAPYVVGDGNTYGAIIAFLQSIAKGSPGSVFLRTGGFPSILGLLTTLAVFIIVIYVEGVRVELPIAHAQYRGFRGRYPIKLLYVSNLPVIFASALFANIYFISQLLWNSAGQPIPGRNFLLDIIGQYQVTASSSGQSQITPIGGLAYFVTAPRDISNVVADPLRALGFAGIMITFCIVFSLTWLEVGGLGPSTVAKQLVDSGMQIPGFRRSGKPIELLLKRYIPTVTIVGGFIVGLIAAVSDFFGVFGSGMGVLLSVGILYQYYELLMQERVAEMYPALRSFFGG
jgi:preprotein translocase SecY subunit